MRHSVRTGTIAALSALLLGALAIPPTAAATDGSDATPASRPGTAGPRESGREVSAQSISSPVRMTDVQFGKVHQIRAVHSEKCLDVQGGSLANGADVFQWPCLSPGWQNENQQWYLRPDIDGIMNISPVHSRKCLDVQGKSSKDAANVFQWDCLGDAARNQRWFLADERFQYGMWTYAILAQHSGKCLDVEGASQLNAANVFQWTCLGEQQLNQRWTFHPVK
ncbi:RICIN domain-containing protein [Streptomyces sp. NPDC097619]|uniref:RICIN domain-containing protein n=1 Tax=Streptomyces sp. NPDC097619 TaxID=3157228 RepID=UPI003322A292